MSECTGPCIWSDADFQLSHSSSGRTMISYLDNVSLQDAVIVAVESKGGKKQVN